MQISNAEWQVMKIVWTRDYLTSKEIYQLISEKFDWKISTVKTLLNRLVNKQCLATEKKGNRFYYSPLISELESINQITAEVSEKTCAKNIKNIISELILNNDFTQEDLDMLEQEISNKREVAVKKVVCNCV